MAADLARGEADRLHDADVAVARQDDPADDVGDREGRGKEREDREGEEDRHVEVGDRVDVGLGLEVGRRAVATSSVGSPAVIARDSRREIGRAWLPAPPGRASARSGGRRAGQRHDVGRAEPGGHVGRADRRGDADDGQQSRLPAVVWRCPAGRRTGPRRPASWPPLSAGGIGKSDHARRRPRDRAAWLCPGRGRPRLARYHQRPARIVTASMVAVRSGPARDSCAPDRAALRAAEGKAGHRPRPGDWR